MDVISIWLKGKKYEYLVDTCCEPDLRKLVQTFGKNYYSTNDGEEVKVITAYDSFDKWWDENHMHQNIVSVTQLA